MISRFLREIGQPQALDAGGFRIQCPHIELRLLAGGGAVLDDAAEIAQAAQAFGGVLSAEHFEDGVDAFAASEILHDFFIVVLLVVDAVLQAEFFYARKFFVGGGRAVHFDAEKLSDLNGRGAHASGDGVDEHAMIRSGQPRSGRLRSFLPASSRGRR